MRGAFLASLESAASTVNYPKSREESSIVIWKTAGKQNSEGFGGGNRVKKR